MIKPSPHPQVRSRRGGIVVPHPPRWYHHLIAAGVYAAIRTVAATLRYERRYPAELLQAEPRQYIFCVWHNRLALSLVIYRDIMRRRGLPPRMAAIVSASRDGGMLARILELFGVQPVRGSTSRRGPQALLELTTWAERGYDLAITPDGPRGPCYVVQEGAIALAQVTGIPLVPASFQIGWKIRPKSWDRFQIPLPFSRAVIRLGEPLHAPRDASDEQREALRRELEQRLKALATD
jgi:lysophospholipid acyltransferase (LPLAT)-like uncharacterized protein